jgi:uncharacterized membrane protein YhaH (DUF805 family)
MGFVAVLFSFQGRIGRAYYWLWVVCELVYLVLLNTVIEAAGIGGRRSLSTPAIGIGPLIALLVVVLVSLIILTWSNLAVHIKRWHDRDKSGWWVLIGLVPIIGGLWTLIECGFLPGKAGGNRFGPSMGGAPQAAAYFD